MATNFMGSNVSFGAPGADQQMEIQRRLKMAEALQGQAGQQQYGSEVGQYNAMMNGLFGLGGAGIMAVSDRRLKTNIVRVGTHPLGIGIYEYDLFGKREVGVMADEVEKVKPEAVGEFAGFKGVNYGML